MYAHLIDIGNTGIEALITMESHKDPTMPNFVYGYDEYLHIYYYIDGAVKELISSKMPPVHWYLSYMQDKSGKTYCYIRDNSGDDTYYYIENGEGKISTVTSSVTPSWHETITVNGYTYHFSNNEGYGNYWVDGKSVDVGEYLAKKEQMKGTFYKVYAADHMQSLKTFEGVYVEDLPDGTVAQTLKSMEGDLPAGYLDTYRTPSAWARTEVENAIAAGFVPQGLQRKYNQPITRAEFCSLATQYYEKSTGSTIGQRTNFSDTSDVSVQKMGGMGIVTGVGDGKFNPNGLLTREAAAVILIRLAAALGNEPAKAAPTFADNGSISTWAYEQVGQAQSIGIMSGTGNNQFSPQQPYTREQSIMTIMRMGGRQESVTSLELKESEIKLFIGTSKTLTPIVQTSSSTANRAITWSSSNSSIASVESTTGKVTAIRGGTAIITGKASNGLSVQCSVIVIQPSGKFYCELPVTVDCEYRKYAITSISESGYGATIEITKLGEAVDSYGVSYTIEGEATVKKVGTNQWVGLYIPYVVEDYNGNVVFEGEAEDAHLGTYVDHYTQYGANVGDKITFKLRISRYNFVEKQGKTESVDLSKGQGYVIKFIGSN